MKDAKYGNYRIRLLGPNLLRNFSNNSKCQVRALCDTNNSLLKKYKKTHPKLDLYTDYKKLINNCEIDACVIATPVMTHYKSHPMH